MISRYEFHTGVSLALAALSPPLPNEAPIVGEGKPGLEFVCFDFWPGGSLRIVGTNGRRLVVVYCKVAGLPSAGRFLMPIADAKEALRVFAPDYPDNSPRTAPLPRVTFALFGLEQMILTSGDDALMVAGTPGTLYPEYHLMLTGDTLPTKGAIFDMGTLAWVMGHATLAGDGAVQMQIRAYGPTTVRPRLRPEFDAIQDVIFAIKPLALAT